MASNFQGGFRTIRRWFWRAVIAGMLLTLLPLLALKFIDPPSWSWRLQRHWFPPAPITRVSHQWRDLAAISSRLQLAVIASEDQRFPDHLGLDWQAIEKALSTNKQGRKVKGASTLTQQTAKNLFLWPSRNLLRKGLEAWFSLWMELLLGKQRILELYLNIVEFGPGIYGAEAAAQHYFHKSAGALSSHEAALLAAVLPNPWQYRIRPPSDYMQQRADWIEMQMRHLGTQTLRRLD
nr:monofunctional biosynthetic peptidoglycan transglycosylase [Shewanella sedimentimangrovi]